MDRNSERLVWAVFAYLFSYSSLLATYWVATNMVDLAVMNTGLGKDDFQKVQEAIQRSKKVLVTGNVFSFFAWLVIICQVIWFKVQGKAYFIITYVWGAAYMLMSPGMALLVLPALLKVTFNWKRVLFPERYEEAEVAPAERMKRINRGEQEVK